MDDPRTIVKRAKELIDDPSRWTKGVYARSGNGIEVGIHDDRAKRWCALGALTKASGERATPNSVMDGPIGDLFNKVVPGYAMSDINDGPGGRHWILGIFDDMMKLAVDA